MGAILRAWVFPQTPTETRWATARMTPAEYVTILHSGRDM